MAITFLDEEDEIAPAVPTTGKRGITFLDEEEPPAEEVVKPEPEPEVLTTQSGRKITFLDEEPTTPTSRLLQLPEAPKTPEFTTQAPSEGVLRQAADLPVQFAVGINNSVKGLTDLFGADNPVSQNLSQNVDWYRSLLSASSKQDEEEVGRILKEAEDKGMLDQLSAGLEAFTVAPADFVASGLGSLAVFAAGGLAGRAAGLGARGIQAVQAGLGAGMGAGIAKGEIYQSVKDEMLAQGKTEEESRQVAMEAQSFGGKNLDQILVAAGLGAASAYTGAEKIISKVLTKGGLDATTTRVGNILKTGLTEAVPEFAQAAQEKFASNLALQREGANISLTQGIFSQGAMEGLVGLGLGMGAGAIEPRIQRPTTEPPSKEQVAAAASETQDVARQNKDVAPATASLVEGQAEQIVQTQETPDQRVARLQEEAAAAAGIELEEEGVGAEPTVPVIPPVEPTPKGAVAPVEPVVPAAGAVEPTAAATPTEPVAPTEPAAAEPVPAVAPRPAVDVEALSPNAKRANRILNNTGVDPETAAFVAQQYQDEIADLGGEELRAFVLDKFEENGGVIPAQMRYSEDQEYYEMAFGIGPEEAATLVENAKGQNAQMAQAELEQNKQWRRKDEQITEAQQGVAVAQPEAQAVPLPAGEVPPSPAIEGRGVPLAAPEAAVTPTPVEPPALAPLRRVVKAEQTEEDVSGLVGQGLVELYNGQPVITQAGLEALPEAERPRLNPEARKIQIDTGSNEVVAEAISKNLRIGVDQVGTGVRMPAGWTLDGDIYVPPQKQEVAVEAPASFDLNDWVLANYPNEYSASKYLDPSAQYKFHLAVWEKAGRPEIDVEPSAAPAPEVRESRREDVRLNPLGYDIATVVEDIKAGRTDGPLRAVNNVIKQSQELRDRVQREAARRQEPRARGKAAILDRLSRERAAGRISEETAQALTDFINRIREDAIGDTAFSIRKGGVSNFNFGETLVSFFLNQDQPATGARVGIHEFFHGLSRFLPDAEVEQMRQDYTKNLAEYLKKNPWFLAFVGRYSLTPEQFEEYKLFNPKEAETKLQPVKDRDGKIVKYQIKYDADNYRYIMLDEWIAEKMTDLVRSKQAVPDTFMGKIAKVIRDFLDLIKARLGKDAYESFYQTITDPKQKLNLYRMSSVAEPFQIYQPQNFNYAEDVLDRIRYTRTERDPIITQAAMDLKEGKIDRDEYQRIVDLRMPLRKFENIPVPASKEDIARGLGNRTINRKDEATGEVVTILKRDLSQSPESIAEGRIVEARLDIPAYEFENVWVVSMHKPRPNLQKGGAGEVIAYSPTAVLRNVEFGVTEPAAINIAAGKQKTTIATMKGSYVPMTAQQAYDLANRGRSEGWVEIGMNPIRHSYFYDKDTQSPVVSAEEVVQVGGMVLAKNPVYGKRDDYRFMALGGEEAGRFPTFETTSPEASTLSTMAASMAKVDAASEAKPNPENKLTYKISEIASVWMDQGGDARQLQDMVVEYTNLTPANAKKVANAIAKQYDIQQSIATAFIETQTGLSVEALPEGVTLPKEVDPDRPRPVMQRLFDVFMGVKVPPVKITVNEKTALNQQIRLKAAATREAKKAQQETANEVVEIIKAMELRGSVRPKQAQALAKRAAKVIWTSEKSIESFTDYAARVVENTNYDADVQAARDAQKRAKALSTQKKVALSPQREVLSDISKIAVNRIEDPRMFAEMVNYYLGGFKAVISPDYVVVPDSEMEGYLSSVKDEEIQSQRELDRAVNLRLAEKYGVDPEEVNEVLAAFDVIKEIEANENREAIDNLLTEKAIETRDGLRAYDSTPLRQDQRRVVDAMAKVDPAALDAEERQRFIRIANNVIFNNQTNGAEYFMSVANGQQNARIAAQDSEMVSRNKAWVNLLPTFGSISAEKTMRGWALELQSVSDTFRNAFGLKSMAKIYKSMGMLDLNSSFTQANNTIDQIQEEMAGFHNKLEKDYGAASRNQDGLLAEGIAGFLIQRVPKKDEADSIAQRRDLIRQDISNRRQSGELDRVAMADRIETILNQIDGTSTQDILDKLKETYRPNYDSLIWYKDTLLPKYKDFLKSFDENFNDQANNYDNPDYLPIAFNSAGPSLAITKEEEQVFYDQVSLRPKQSANTIKRVDYSTLPKDRTTGTPKEIEFNLRRSAFNSLSDQINKAYTSGAWQQIASFMKTPESTQVFGGQANKDFFVDRLNRLRLSRMRRGAMSRGAFEKAADAVGVISRKLGTGIALGGVYQWIKQPPDQLVTAWGSGARGEVLARNIAPSNQRAARTLLNKFSIGRRGDASAGYKYINQMEGHQNRLERYFSESKWDQAKEQAGKIADVWMIGLKKSDFIAASAAWMTYYETELNKRNIKITDWNKESELIDGDNDRQEAAAYAEQMTDIYQGSSDPTQMAVFAQSGKSGAENLLKAMFVPFNSFAVQQRMRLYSDVRDVLSGDKRSRGGLAGTIGGLILFHATKRYVLPVISGSAIGVLYSLMGVDVEEPDEEKQKEQASKNFRQFLADASSNLLVGGMPQVIESQLIKSFNYAAYLTAMQLEDESVMGDDGELISFDKYQKERSPLYRYQTYGGAMSLGMLEIGFDQAKQVALSTKMVASEEEMEAFTPEEKRLLYFSALSDWLYLMRLNDTDFARLVQKARRDMIKSAEEREKELARIRAGR